MQFRPFCHEAIKLLQLLHVHALYLYKPPKIPSHRIMDPTDFPYVDCRNTFVAGTKSRHIEIFSSNSCTKKFRECHYIVRNNMYETRLTISQMSAVVLSCSDLMNQQYCNLFFQYDLQLKNVFYTFKSSMSYV